MQDGNLGRGLRKLKNLPEPVAPEPVKEEEAVAVEPTEEEEKPAKKDSEDTDLAVFEKQSISTSSPTNSSSFKQKEMEEPEDGEEVENEDAKMET
jgi:hypothetical protein